MAFKGRRSDNSRINVEQVGHDLEVNLLDELAPPDTFAGVKLDLSINDPLWRGRLKCLMTTTRHYMNMRGGYDGLSSKQGHGR